MTDQREGFKFLDRAIKSARDKLEDAVEDSRELEAVLKREGHPYHPLAMGLRIVVEQALESLK